MDVKYLLTKMHRQNQSYDCFLKALECNPTDIGAFFNLSASILPDEKKLIKFEKFLKMSAKNKKSNGVLLSI